jgi:hypothetical protein
VIVSTTALSSFGKGGLDDKVAGNIFEWWTMECAQSRFESVATHISTSVKRISSSKEGTLRILGDVWDENL